MIYSYRPLDHKISLLHEHIAYIFKQMFRHAPSSFDENLLVHPDFLPIIGRAKKSIKKPLAEIIEAYHNLPFGERKKIEIAFSYNNCIDSLTNKNIHPIKYDELDESIQEKLKVFFVNLWENYPQVVQMEHDFGSLKEVYDKIVEDNDIYICPFCGIEGFEPPGGNYREAYDHLLAKSDYPFASVNFKLLFPMCHKCNSKEKGTADPFYDSAGSRREIIYPCDENYSTEDLKISVIPLERYNKKKMETILRSIKWAIGITLKGRSDDRMEAWDDIFDIRGRFSRRLGRYEKHWFYELQVNYKNSLKDKKSFIDFKEQFLKTVHYQICIMPMGMIRYVYFTFLFSLKNFESNLKQTL